MTFLHLAMLGGLALGLVPIIIHILARRRHKTVRWGAMKYLLAAIEENRKRVQIEDLILMALRVLAILLLVLALARPRFSEQGATSGGGPRLVVLLVDNSPSMLTRRGGSSRFDTAKVWAQELLKRLAPGSAVAVVPMAGPVGAAVGALEPTRELGFAGRAVGELAISGRRADPAAALAVAREALGRSELPARTVETRAIVSGCPSITLVFSRLSF